MKIDGYGYCRIMQAIPCENKYARFYVELPSEKELEKFLIEAKERLPEDTFFSKDSNNDLAINFYRPVMFFANLLCFDGELSVEDIPTNIIECYLDDMWDSHDITVVRQFFGYACENLEGFISEDSGGCNYELLPAKYCYNSSSATWFKDAYIEFIGFRTGLPNP